MADKLKDTLFSDDKVRQVARAIGDAVPGFDVEAMVGAVIDDRWPELALKARMRHVTERLHEALALPYPEALDVLYEIAPNAPGFFAIVLPDYVECYGLDDPERSLPALAYFTRFGSSEFAIRPFLDADPEATLPVMLEWAHDDNEHVRRLASEGCRPRLPWAMALPAFKADPAPLLPILEALHDDPSEYVRRSVANNLNDISKDHPDVVLEVAERWLGQTAETDKLVKHALRTQLKAGDTRALVLFGFTAPDDLHIDGLTITPAAVAIGDDIRFEFTLRVGSATAAKVRLEYVVHFVKKRGTSPKVFQIREGTFDPGEHAFRRKHSFQDRSTRKHYPGRHELAIVVNGVEKVRGAMEVV